MYHRNGWLKNSFGRVVSTKTTTTRTICSAPTTAVRQPIWSGSGWGRRICTLLPRPPGVPDGPHAPVRPLLGRGCWVARRAWHGGGGPRHRLLPLKVLYHSNHPRVLGPDVPYMAYRTCIKVCKFAVDDAGIERRLLNSSNSNQAQQQPQQAQRRMAIRRVDPRGGGMLTRWS